MDVGPLDTSDLDDILGKITQDITAPPKPEAEPPGALTLAEPATITVEPNEDLDKAIRDLAEHVKGALLPDQPKAPTAETGLASWRQARLSREWEEGFQAEDRVLASAATAQPDPQHGREREGTRRAGRGQGGGRR